MHPRKIRCVLVMAALVLLTKFMFNHVLKGTHMFLNNIQIRSYFRRERAYVFHNSIAADSGEKHVKEGSSTLDFPGKSCFRLTWEVIDTNSLRNCGFVTADTKFRLGNALFIAASVYGTAYKLDMVPVINPSHLISKYMNLPNLSNAKLMHTHHNSYSKCCMYDASRGLLDATRNWTLGGFSQSWKYFIDAEHVIRNIFQFRDEYLTPAKKFLQNVTRSGHVNVCIHVRRGDMTEQHYLNYGYLPANKEYIQRAMGYMVKALKKVLFIVLSDDIKWSKVNIHGENVVYSPFSHPAVDLALMTSCDHVIITTGTFGWWGAWLANGITVYNTKFMVLDSELGWQYNMNDYFPSNWKGL